MDITSITAAYNGLKSGKDILKSLFDLKVSAEAKEKVDSVLVKLGDAQDALFQMREELFRLQEENKKLRDASDAMKIWEDKASKYDLTQTPGGAVVYQFSGAPVHYACTSCFSKKFIEILQDNRTASGKFRCVACKAEYPINPRKNNPTVGVVKTRR